MRTLLFLSLLWVAMPSQAQWIERPTGPAYFAVLGSDLDALEAWYLEAFGGYRESAASGDGFEIRNLISPGARIELIMDQRMADAGERARGFFKLGVSTGDLDGMADRVEASTGERPRVLSIGSARFLQLRDPEGNRVQIFESSPRRDEVLLLAMHAELLRAHRDNDVEAWMAIEADTTLSVNGGEISFSHAAERRSEREAYLGSAEFEIYRDVAEPEVTVSVDGTLAWLAAEVEVRGRMGDATFHDVWAWVELYRKTDAGWKLVGNASNRRDP
ncbi:MAG: DUF4440 domain-containing protein [Rhodothermales bacterium]|nr:DUF4440 domain-containing protein [Rhodothermales bacterium]MBO6780264.1 DUF4440 domain-containing protein [Rhodothermales bacterium]